ncbi:hypothetical protein HK098_002536 [Nowakowskiella sp. JEL0407]|nr:hypothetical protein HK098_002536 [Nowakowskiella sp. JEL0407]
MVADILSRLTQGLVSYNENTITIRNPANETVSRISPVDMIMNEDMIAYNGTHLAYVTAENMIHLVDTDAGRLSKVLVGYTSRAVKIEISNDRRSVVSFHENDTRWQWNVITGECQTTLNNPTVSSDSPNSNSSPPTTGTNAIFESPQQPVSQAPPLPVQHTNETIDELSDAPSEETSTRKNSGKFQNTIGLLKGQQRECIRPYAKGVYRQIKPMLEHIEAKGMTEVQFSPKFISLANQNLESYSGRDRKIWRIQCKGSMAKFGKSFLELRSRCGTQLTNRLLFALCLVFNHLKRKHKNVEQLFDMETDIQNADIPNNVNVPEIAEMQNVFYAPEPVQVQNAYAQEIAQVPNAFLDFTLTQDYANLAVNPSMSSDGFTNFNPNTYIPSSSNNSTVVEWPPHSNHFIITAVGGGFPYCGNGSSFFSIPPNPAPPFSVPSHYSDFGQGPPTIRPNAMFSSESTMNDPVTSLPPPSVVSSSGMNHDLSNDGFLPSDFEFNIADGQSDVNLPFFFENLLASASSSLTSDPSRSKPLNVEEEPPSSSNMQLFDTMSIPPNVDHQIAISGLSGSSRREEINTPVSIPSSSPGNPGSIWTNATLDFPAAMDSPGFLDEPTISFATFDSAQEEAPSSEKSGGTGENSFYSWNCKK